MKPEIIHMLGEEDGRAVLDGPDIRTRCGRDGSPVSVNSTRFKLLGDNGSEFFGTTQREYVTCRKCVSLLTSGTLQPTRAGPPTPRSRPWRADEMSHREKALTFGSSVGYDERRAAWEAYHAEHCKDWTPLTESAEKDGFFAGFAACLAFSPKVEP